MKIFNVVGARPNFIKVAALWRVEKQNNRIEPFLVHTGQHSLSMTSRLLEQLELPQPDFYLGDHFRISRHPLGSVLQLTSICDAFARLLLESRPNLVIVVGDVNSTISCALAASLFDIPIAHVEAGLRSGDRSMPEEINRILTDHLSQLHFTTSLGAKENLLREGISSDSIEFVGNTVIDTLVWKLPEIESSNILTHLDVRPKSYVVLTVHRVSNVDNESNLKSILAAVERIQRKIPIVFPVHPRKRSRLKEYGLITSLSELPNLRIVDPLDYLDFVKVVKESKFVITDSGGIQDETAYLGISCLTLRESTERPETVLAGTNYLVGTTPDKIIQQAERWLGEAPLITSGPHLWDGHSAERIVQRILDSR